MKEIDPNETQGGYIVISAEEESPIFGVGKTKRAAWLQALDELGDLSMMEARPASKALVDKVQRDGGDVVYTWGIGLAENGGFLWALPEENE